MIAKLVAIDLVMQAACLDPPPHLVTIILQGHVEDPATPKDMLAGYRSPGRQGNRLRHPQGRLAGAAIGDNRADVAAAERVAEQPLPGFDGPVIEAGIPLDRVAGILARPGCV